MYNIIFKKDIEYRMQYNTTYNKKITKPYN